MLRSASARVSHGLHILCECDTNPNILKGFRSCADQIMEQNGKLLFCILFILGLLPYSAVSRECSSSTDNFVVLSCPRCDQNTSILFQNGSEESNLKLLYGPLLFSGFNVGQAFVYILLDLTPLMVYFPVLILFNVNLASGPAQSFVFFYQALPAAIGIDSLDPLGYNTILGGVFWGTLTMQSPINHILFPRTLPYIALQYCKLAAVLVAIVMTVVLVKCVDCPCTSWRRPWAKLRRSVRHFREKRACKGTVLNGFCSIAILTYGFVIQQSFSVLQPARSCSGHAKYCAYYCTELELGHEDYRIPLIVASAAIILIVALLLPLLLLYYPCVPALMQRVTKRSPQFMTCHKLAPVLDVFQSAYKPKLRFFAALPLLYRFVIWLLFSALSAAPSVGDRQIVITFVFIVTLAIHSLVQPYRRPKHNYIETLYLVNLVLISIVLLIIPLAVCNLQSKLPLVLSFLPSTLVWLPILVAAGNFIWKRKCCKRCRAACCKKAKRNRRESAQSEAVQDLMTSSEVYFDMSEVGQMNQD